MVSISLVAMNPSAGSGVKVGAAELFLGAEGSLWGLMGGRKERTVRATVGAAATAVGFSRIFACTLRRRISVSTF
jgi:hypothetical protein